MVNTDIRLIIFLEGKDEEALYSVLSQQSTIAEKLVYTNVISNYVINLLLLPNFMTLNI